MTDRKRITEILGGLVAETLKYADVARTVDLNPYIDWILGYTRRQELPADKVEMASKSLDTLTREALKLPPAKPEPSQIRCQDCDYHSCYFGKDAAARGSGLPKDWRNRILKGDAE